VIVVLAGKFVVNRVVDEMEEEVGVPTCVVIIDCVSFVVGGVVD
jgi:hypothetical protein